MFNLYFESNVFPNIISNSTYAIYYQFFQLGQDPPEEFPWFSLLVPSDGSVYSLTLPLSISEGASFTRQGQLCTIVTPGISLYLIRHRFTISCKNLSTRNTEEIGEIFITLVDCPLPHLVTILRHLH